MMIVTVSHKRKQDKTVLKLTGDLLADGDEATQYHLDIIDIKCKKAKCFIDDSCTDFNLGCRTMRAVTSRPCKTPKREAKVAPVLRYIPDSIDDCSLTFSWCDKLWGLPSGLYDAVLYRDKQPCGRFRIQLRSAVLAGADTTPVNHC